MTREQIQKELNSIKESKFSHKSDGELNRLRSHNIPVYQYDLEGNYLRSFESSVLVAKYLKITNVSWTSYFRDLRKGLVNSIKGYLWSHDKVDKLVIPKKYKYIVYDMEGNEVTKAVLFPELTQSLGYKSKSVSLKTFQTWVKDKYVIKKLK